MAKKKRRQQAKRRAVAVKGQVAPPPPNDPRTKLPKSAPPHIRKLISQQRRRRTLTQAHREAIRNPPKEAPKYILELLARRARRRNLVEADREDATSADCVQAAARPQPERPAPDARVAKAGGRPPTPKAEKDARARALDDDIKKYCRKNPECSLDDAYKALHRTLKPRRNSAAALKKAHQRALKQLGIGARSRDK